MLSTISRKRRIELSLVLNCSEQYLYQIFTGRRQPSPQFAMKLNRIDPDLFQLAALRKDAREIWGVT
jgi:hypothetical protein